MGRFVIAAFRPKAGQQDALRTVLERHRRVLRAEDLVTDRPPYAMLAADGTIIEIFEWRSADSIAQAHRNTAVQALWAECDTHCNYVPLADLAESRHPFAEFESLDLE
jgi:quinol monooxygenase YgiN